MGWRTARQSVVVLAVALSACATPVPEYTGPTALVGDFARQESNARVQVFYVSEVNGKPIHNSVDETRRLTRGGGVMPWFTATPISRRLPAGKTRLKLEGRVMYSAPIQEIFMANTLYTIEEEIDVDLLPGKAYVVKGDLFENKRQIYLEDVNYNRVGTKVVK